MIPSATELGAFGLLYAAPSSRQVTMGCDHVLIPNALSAFANGKEMAQLSTMRPSNLMVLNSLDAAVGPG